jgi:hypothetical protein
MASLLARLGEAFYIVLISLICYLNQSFIKPALIGTSLIATDKQDSLAHWVKGKRHSPDLAAE